MNSCSPSCLCSRRLRRGFKALKQLVKLHYKLKQYDKMMDSYRMLLSYAESSTVTKNASEKKINSLLDFMAGASDSEVSVMLGNHYLVEE